MYKARNTDGTWMFNSMEWLSNLQIQGFFFSPLAAKRKQTDGKKTSSDDAEPDDSEELAVEYAVHITSNNQKQNGGYPHYSSFSGPLKMVAA